MYVGVGLGCSLWGRILVDAFRRAFFGYRLCVLCGVATTLRGGVGSAPPCVECVVVTHKFFSILRFYTKHKT